MWKLLGSFIEAYHAGEAEIWEEMALTRARVVAGDDALAKRAEASIRAILSRKREPAKVATAVAEMRALIAREKGEKDPWDLKLAAGGITDLDFLAQFFVLAYASGHPGLIVNDTASVFVAAKAAGLLSDGDASVLLEAHRLIGDVQLWQRFTVEEAFDPKAVPPRVLRRIATAVGRPDAKVLKAELDEVRSSVRAIFTRVLGEARKGS